MKVKLEVNLASYLRALALTRLKGKPAVIWLIILDQVGAESNMAKEGLAVRSVVNGDIDLSVVTNDVTAWR